MTFSSNANKLLSLVGTAALALTACQAPTDSEDPSEDPAEASEEALTVGERLHLRNHGVVHLSGSGQATTAFALFNHVDDEKQCDVRDIGLFCQVVVCTDNRSIQMTPTDAGKLTIATPAKTIELTPDADHVYPFHFENENLLPAGASVSVSALGGAFPAFSLRKIKVPSPITVTSPANIDRDSTLEIDTSRDLVLSWTGADRWVDVEMIRSVGQYVDAPQGGGLQMLEARDVTTLNCSFPAGLRTARIPAAALASFPKGETSTPIDNGQPPAGDVVTHDFQITSTNHAAKILAKRGRVAGVDVVIANNNYMTSRVTFR